ncbi:MAG: G4 quadruplex nucleic acid binding protein [Geoglossum simile]|nr:MAG: G4 quadruplex nucleic acid binding protein [Geoglossum simile]
MTTSLSISPSDPLLTLLQRSFPSALPTSTTNSSSPSALTLPSGSVVQGTNTIVAHLSPKIFPETSYTDIENAEIAQWLTLSARLAPPPEDADKVSDLLKTLNAHLSTRTTLLGAKPSIADVALYSRIARTVVQWTPEQRTGENGYHHIVRFVDFVQNAPVFGLGLKEGEKVMVDVDNVIFVQKPVDPREEKDKRKKAAAATAAAAAAAEGESGRAAEGTRSKKDKAKGKLPEAKEAVRDVAASANPMAPKKEKKEKAPKAPKAPAKEASLTPSLIDLRVGHIIKAVNHPNADSLYVSTIACGDPPSKEGTSEYEGQIVRTVCSGLNGLVPLEEMQDRKVVVVCNLKPVTMRGVKSSAMVLAASPRPVEGEAPDDGHKGPVELVTPPVDAKAGERVFFEGWNGEPEGQLNPKKKIWETLQPGFTTTKKLEVGFDSAVVPQLRGEVEGSTTGAGRGVGRLVTESGGVCVVNTLTGAVVR